MRILGRYSSFDWLKSTKIGWFLIRSVEWLPLILSFIVALCVISFIVAILVPEHGWVSYSISAIAAIMVVYIRALPYLVERYFKMNNNKLEETIHE